MERFKFYLCYLLTHADAITEFGPRPLSLCPCPLSLCQQPQCVTPMGARAFTPYNASRPRCPLATNTLLIPQSLAIKKTTSN